MSDGTPNNNDTTIVFWGWFLNILSLTSVFCFSGIIFGWAPLELWLLEEEQYSEYCNTSGENNEAAAAPACPEQMNHLNAMFTIAQFLLSFVSLPVGYIVDTCPKSWYFVMAGSFEIVGLVTFAISDTTQQSGNNNNNYFYLSYALIALGGGMTMLGAFPASFLLPNYQTAILASISCLFDSSSIVFFVFYKLRHLLSRKHWFIIWMVVAVVIYTSLAIGWFRLEQLQQKKNEGKRLELEEEGVSLMNNASTADEIEDEEEHTTTDEHYQRVTQQGYHSMTVAQQLCTFEYGLALFFTCCQMLRCNFFVMTVDHFLYVQGDVQKVYANLFSWILPCGVLVVPLIDITVQKFGIVKALQVTNGIGFVFGLLLLVPSYLPIQAINFGIFTCFRAYLYATLNTFIAYSFGVKTMGRLIGFVFTMAAVNTLFQYPLSVWAGTTNFATVNIVLLVTLGLFPCLATLIYQKRNINNYTTTLTGGVGSSEYGSIS